MTWSKHAPSPRSRGSRPAQGPDAADLAALELCVGEVPAGLEALYARYAGSCLALARSVLVDPHHAEDAVQEAFLDLWRCADRFDGQRSSVRSWLLLLTHRKAVDRVRSEQRRRTSALVAEHDDVADDVPWPDAEALARLLSAQTRGALAVLSSVKREALLLAYWGGCTQQEIAVLTGTPLGTVKTRTRTGLQELHAALGRAGLRREEALTG